MQFGNYLSADDLSRIVQDARYAERLMQSPGLPFGYPTVQASPDTNFDAVVLITDVESQGYYTGRVLLLNYALPAPTWVLGSSLYVGLNNDIRVAVMNSADKLALNWAYPCRILGPGEQSNPYPDEPIAVALWTVPLGCGLKYSPLNYVEVDLDQIAGYGLFVNTSGDCPKLDVNAAVLNSNVTVFDCGLEYDVVNTTLRVNFTSVVVPPLVWSGCSLDLAISCGLDVIGGSLVVDNVDLAGDNTLTSLVVGPGDCDLAVDFEVASTVNWRRDVITFFGRVAGGKIRLCYSIYVDTDEYNAAGLLLSHVVGDPSNVCREVDVCDPVCCDDCDITYTSHVSPTTGAAPLAVTFTVDTLSGCTSPYSLFIDWGDGSSETHAGVSAGATYGHTYATTGTYSVDSVASDECGFAAATTTVVVVSTAGGTVVGCCPDAIPNTLCITFENLANCSCLEGQQTTLTYDPVLLLWTGSLTGHGCADMFIRLECGSEGGFHWILNINGCAASTGFIETSSDCGPPLSVVFESSGSVFGCCDIPLGQFRATVAPCP